MEDLNELLLTIVKIAVRTNEERKEIQLGLQSHARGHHQKTTHSRRRRDATTLPEADPSMEERPVSHRSSCTVTDADEDDLPTQWNKWRRAAALSRRTRRAPRVAVPASPTCACGGRMHRVPKPRPMPTAVDERADGACGGLAPVLPPAAAAAAWYPYDLMCTECDGETGWRRRKPACWAADWKAARPRQRWRPYPSFADVAAALGDLRLGAGDDDDHSGDVDMISCSFQK